MRLYRKAHIASKEGRLVRISINGLILPIFIFMGKSRDYLVSENYCTCKYFFFNVILEKKSPTCYHILALKEAIKNDQVRNITISFNEFRDILYEIYSSNFSLTLRQIINKSLR